MAKVRHCGKCGKAGHYSSTCKAEKIVMIAAERGMMPVTITAGRLIVNGEIEVDQKRYPALYRALQRGKALVDGQKALWQKALDLRKQGQDAAADRVINKILGISKPMSEEAKAKLREYNEKNREAIKERQRQKREVRKRTLELVKGGAEKLTRKRGG